MIMLLQCIIFGLFTFQSGMAQTNTSEGYYTIPGIPHMKFRTFPLSPNKSEATMPMVLLEDLKMNTELVKNVTYNVESNIWTTIFHSDRASNFRMNIIYICTIQFILNCNHSII